MGGLLQLLQLVGFLELDVSFFMVWRALQLKKYIDFSFNDILTKH